MTGPVIQAGWACSPPNSAILIDVLRRSEYQPSRTEVWLGRRLLKLVGKIRAPHRSRTSANRRHLLATEAEILFDRIQRSTLASCHSTVAIVHPRPPSAISRSPHAGSSI
jgi:hypothetical protein